jgi:hypothetical protein
VKLQQSTSPVLILSAVALSLSSVLALAEDDFRQHQAHIHGSVEFNIAQDGQDLLVEILAPGADIVGFEHHPKNAQQTETLHNALDKLNDSESILKLPSAAKCAMVSASITHTLGVDDKKYHSKHDHHEHDHDTHISKHDDHDKHEHSEHHEEHHGESTHGAFNIAYQYQCQDFSKLNQIDTDWFQLFPATQGISVNLLTDSAQLATELKKANTLIKL